MTSSFRLFAVVVVAGLLRLVVTGIEALNCIISADMLIILALLKRKCLCH
jgi:LytS/YehU family sensor histidine kinase